MATMIEMLGAQSVAQNSKDPMAGVTESFQGGLKTAVGLAQAKQSMAAQEQQLADAKEAAETAKFNKMTGYMSTLARTRPEVAKKMIPAMKAQLQASGIAFDPGVLDLMATDDGYKSRFNAITTMLAEGSKDPAARAEALAAMQDVGAFDQGLAALASQGKQAQQLDIANAKLAMQEKALAAKMAKSEDAIDRKITKEDSKALFDVKNKFDAAVKDDVEALSNAKKASALLNAGGTISSAAAQSTIARMFEKGVLTDADLNRLAGGKGLYDRGAQLAQFAIDGKLTDANRKELQRIVNTLTPAFEAKIKARAEREVESASKIWKGIPKERFAEVLTSPAETTAPTAVVPNMTAAKKLAALPDKAKAKAALEKQLGRALLAEEAALFGGQ